LQRLGPALVAILCFCLPCNANGLASKQVNFLGNIPSSCSFSDVEETSEMVWRNRWNDFFGRSDFSVTSNSSSIQLSISSIGVSDEPDDIPSGTYVFARLYSPDNSIISSSTKSANGSPNSFGVEPGVSKDLNIRIWVYTNSRNEGLTYLRPGSYSYTVTVSCLQ